MLIILQKHHSVCFVDDDLKKLNQKIEGIPVVGTCPEIVKICDEYRIDNIIVAVPSCEEDEKRKILDYCSATECKIKIIPYLGELLFDDGIHSLFHRQRKSRLRIFSAENPLSLTERRFMTLSTERFVLLQAAAVQSAVSL